MDTFILLGSFFGLMAVGVPIAYALGLASVAGALWIDIPLDAVMIQIASGVNKFSLLAIPFFVLAAAVMNEFGVTRRIFDFANHLVGWMRGGLAQVAIVSNMVFAGISGSALADIAGLGTIIINAMTRHGYRLEFAAGITVAASIVAPILRK